MSLLAENAPTAVARSVPGQTDPADRLDRCIEKIATIGASILDPAIITRIVGNNLCPLASDLRPCPPHVDFP